MLTIDIATDVPLISHNFLQRHPTLKDRTVHDVPRSALDIRSANGSSMEILGSVFRFETWTHHTGNRIIRRAVTRIQLYPLR